MGFPSGSSSLPFGTIRKTRACRDKICRPFFYWKTGENEILSIRNMNMDIVCSTITDYDAWISLARQVEPLFGPMADELDFQDALKQAIASLAAFCIRSAPDGDNKRLIGGVVISRETNEIAWLAVSQEDRGKGYGRRLIEFAISKLNQQENMFVQTFDKSVCEGEPARKLYLDVGFTDFKDGGPNPAGVPTVIMQLKPLKTN